MNRHELQASRMAALASESELWEYLIAHDEVADFEKWVTDYRKRLEDDN